MQRLQQVSQEDKGNQREESKGVISMNIQMKNYEELTIEAVSDTGAITDRMHVCVCTGDLYVQGRTTGGHAKRVLELFPEKKKMKRRR
jgi:hypothetical protein